MSKLPPPKLLVITPDVIGKKMAGPGMRYVAVAKAMAAHMPVTFAVGVEGSQEYDFGDHNVTTRTYTHVDELNKIIDDCEVIFCQFVDTNAARYALEHGKRIIYDLYNALPVETIGAEKISGYTTIPDKDREYGELLNYFKFCVQTGSYFVTSNTYQRDWWLGFMMANRALMPSNLHGRTLEDIIGLMSFGMEEQEPRQTSHGLRGKFGITDEDFILVWNGGIWDWYDAETPIRAVAELSKKDPRIKLSFYGTTHPNSAVGRPKNTDRAIALAKKLNVYNTNVLFNDDWVPIDERVNYLGDSDVALSSHRKTIETHFAFRTRILDHFWVSLPSIVTDGEWFSDYIDTNDLGIVTPCGDVDAMKKAITDLQNQNTYSRIKQNVNSIRDEWRWSKTTDSLRDFIINDLHTTPLILLPVESYEAAPQTLAGFLKQTKTIKRLKSTRAWPYIRKAKRVIKR